MPNPETTSEPTPTPKRNGRLALPDAPDPAGFPILQRRLYLNHAAVSPWPQVVHDAVAGFAQRWATTPYEQTGDYALVRRIKERIARLVGAKGPHEFAMVPNTSTGLSLVAQGLSWTPGDRIVTSNIEFPTNRYVWDDLAQRFGVELDVVPVDKQQRLPTERVIEAIGPRTRLVALSHVQFATGTRIDPEPIAQAVHAVGGYLCLDAIQSVGLMPMDVEGWGVDFFSADGHKWMLGPEGQGVFYCRAEHLTQLRPMVPGWLGMKDPFDHLNYRFEYVEDGRRFEPGSHNLVGAAGLDASLTLLEDFGVANVWQRVKHLTDRLVHGLQERGYPVVSPRNEGEVSGNVVFTQRHNGLSQSAGGIEELHANLRDAGIDVAMRGGRIRISPHFYNTDEHIDRVLEHLR